MRQKIKWTLYHIKCHIITFIYFLLPYCYGLNKKNNRKEKIIISLTSYPDRFQSLLITLKSIFLQKRKADKIVLWLSKTQCQNTDLSKIYSLKKYGLEINLVENDYRQHKKYLYVFEQYREEIVITIDDDVIYPPQMISKLYRKHIEFPNSVIASKVIFRGERFDDEVLDYNKLSTPSFRISAVGCGGVLYCPKLFNKEVLNINKAIKETTSDDMWLYCSELRDRIPIVYAKGANDHIVINKLDKGKPMTDTNIGENGFKKSYDNLRKIYNLTDEYLVSIENSLQK